MVARFLIILCASILPVLTAQADDPGPFSQDNPLPSGAWRYRVWRSSALLPCRHGGEPACNPVSLEVQNLSPGTLECEAERTPPALRARRCRP